MTTLSDKAILSGADNRPPMLEKDMYNSWKSRMELYMINRQHGRMILEFIENGPLIWHTIKENEVTRLKKYYELSATEAIQADCDVKVTNIILQGLLPEVYALVSNHQITKELWEIIQLLMQGTLLTKHKRECKLYDEFDKFAYKKEETLRDFYLRFSLLLNDMNIYNVKLEQFQGNTKFLNTLPPEWSKFVIDVKLVWDLHTTNIDQLHAYLGQHEFHANEVRLMHERSSDPLALVQGDDPIDAINHMMSFLSAVVTSRYPTTNNQLRNPLNPRQQATINDGKVTLQPVQGRQISFTTGTSRTYTLGASGSNSGKQRTVQAQANGQILHEEELAFLADPGTIEVALLANLSHYSSNALTKVHNYDNMDNNMINQAVHVIPSSKQSNVMNYSETEITSDSNIILYSQYVQESQQAAVHNSSSSAQQDALILYVIEQLKTQVVNCTKINLDNKSVNDTLTVELERYKEQVKVLKEGQNVDLKSKDNVSDPCEQSVEIDRLKQTLSEHLKEKESLMQTVTLLKHDFKKEETRNIDREIALEKKIKQLNNIKAQQLEPKLYDGNVIKNTSAIVIPDSEETLMLAEESHSKMILKQQDPIMLERKVNTTPVDYANSMNSLDPTPSCRPTKVEVPKELPKVSMVNTSLKKLKQHLAGFDVVIKERTMTTTITEGSCGFDHTKVCFRDEIILFVKSLKDLFNKFNQYLIDELSEVQNVFHQMDQAVEQHHNASVNMHECEKFLKLEIELLNKKDFIEKETFEKLLQEKDLVITALKNELRKHKGKDLADNVVTKCPIAPEMLKIDVEYLNPRLLNNRSAHSDYLRHTQEQAAILREIVEQGKSQNPLNESLDSACKYTKLIQELLLIVGQTCPSINNSSDKLVVVTPKNKEKRVRFTEPITSSGNTNTKTASSSNLVSNKPMLSSTGVKPSTSASGSQPSSNTKKDKIQRTPSSTQENKVEAHPRTIKSSLKIKNCFVEPKRNANVQHSKLNANSELLCVKCNGCMLSDNHDLCVLDFINDVNARNKSKSIKNNSKRKV
ncbi:hypothetical protein Tco_1336220 [Tanacetum coccineum]